MKTVTAAYAKANLSELLKKVAKGESVTISRYNIPLADLVPSQAALRQAPKFGTLRGKIPPVEPSYFVPMTDEELDAFVDGRYWMRVLFDTEMVYITANGYLESCGLSKWTLLQQAAEDLRLTIIPFTPEHAYRLFVLPVHHRDPFDRMLIATALTEDIPIVGSDGVFKLAFWDCWQHLPAAFLSSWQEISRSAAN